MQVLFLHHCSNNVHVTIKKKSTVVLFVHVSEMKYTCPFLCFQMILVFVLSIGSLIIYFINSTE